VTSALGGSSDEHGTDNVIPDQLTCMKIMLPLSDNPWCVQSGRVTWVDTVASGRGDSSVIHGGSCSPIVSVGGGTHFLHGTGSQGWVSRS
jgi:hypothetical protein